MEEHVVDTHSPVNRAQDLIDIGDPAARDRGPTARGPGSPSRATAAPLRRVLRLNAGFSAVTGAVGLAAGGWAGRELGIGDEWTARVRLVGAGLIGFAAVLLVVAAAPLHRMAPAALAVVAGDLGWVVATVVLVAAGAFSPSGAIIASVLGVIVLDFAIVQFRARRRAVLVSGRSTLGAT